MPNIEKTWVFFCALGKLWEAYRSVFKLKFKNFLKLSVASWSFQWLQEIHIKTISMQLKLTQHLEGDQILGKPPLYCILLYNFYEWKNLPQDKILKGRAINIWISRCPLLFAGHPFYKCNAMFRVVNTLKRQMSTVLE